MSNGFNFISLQFHLIFRFSFGFVVFFVVKYGDHIRVQLKSISYYSSCAFEHLVELAISKKNRFKWELRPFLIQLRQINWKARRFGQVLVEIAIAQIIIHTNHNQMCVCLVRNPNSVHVCSAITRTHSHRPLCAMMAPCASEWLYGILD